MAVSCGRKTVCMTRHKGSYAALDNRCPHQGGPLGEGSMVGHSNLVLADAIRRREAAGEMTFVGIRHEGAASFAASAYGKLTGRPAAWLSIAGPGATIELYRSRGIPDRRRGSGRSGSPGAAATVLASRRYPRHGITTVFGAPYPDGRQRVPSHMALSACRSALGLQLTNQDKERDL